MCCSQNELYLGINHCYQVNFLTVKKGSLCIFQCILETLSSEFFLNLLLLCRVFPRCFPGVSRVFPGCFPGVPRHNFLYLSFTLLKIPTAFAKLATLIQNISKCTFPWCFPGVSRAFPGTIFFISLLLC